MSESLKQETVMASVSRDEQTNPEEQSQTAVPQQRDSKESFNGEPTADPNGSLHPQVESGGEETNKDVGKGSSEVESAVQPESLANNADEQVVDEHNNANKSHGDDDDGTEKANEIEGEPNSTIEDQEQDKNTATPIDDKFVKENDGGTDARISSEEKPNIEEEAVQDNDADMGREAVQEEVEKEKEAIQDEVDRGTEASEEQTEIKREENVEGEEIKQENGKESEKPHEEKTVVAKEEAPGEEEKEPAEESFDRLEEKNSDEEVDDSQDKKTDSKKEKIKGELAAEDSVTRDADTEETKANEEEVEENRSGRTTHRQPRKDLDTEKVYGEMKLSKGEIDATVERLHNSKKEKSERQNANQVKGGSKQCSQEEIDGIVERLSVKKERPLPKIVDNGTKKKETPLTKDEVETLAERLAANKKGNKPKGPNRVTEVEAKHFKNLSAADRSAKVEAIVNRLSTKDARGGPPDSKRNITRGYKESGIMGSYAAHAR